MNSSPWKLRFWSIWLGQAFSLIGSALTNFVLLWWITQTTGSAQALALAGAAGMLPQALLAPFGGVLADRYSRRLIMIVADSITAASMLLLIALFASNTIQLWHIYALMFVRSSMQAFQQPASAASTANLVPADWLPRSAGLNQAVLGIMTIAAAPLGALALAVMPLQNALMIDVVTALLGIVPLLIFRIPQPKTTASAKTSFLTELREGVGYVAKRRGLTILYALLALVVLTIMPMFVMTPLLVKDHFKGGANQVALMEGLAGAGMIVGGVLISFWPIFKRRIVTVLVTFAISCFTVALTALAPGDWLWLGVVWWTISGLTFSMGNPPLMTIVQSNVPNELQGRVLSLLNMVMGIAGPLGTVLAGLLGEALGVRALFIIGGTASALVCVAGFLSKDLLSIEAVKPQAQQQPADPEGQKTGSVGGTHNAKGQARGDARA